MTDDTHATRRTIVRATGAAVLGTSLAGCTNVIGTEEGNSNVVLDPPENYERRKEIDLPYPTYGQELPSVSVPAPLHDRTVETTEFVGQRHTMLTFIYTSCQTVCPGLTTSLRRVQADSIEQGYAEEFAFMPTTFDPEHDTGDVLHSYGNDLGVDFAVGNWYFLRPESPADAKAIVEETFGVAFEQGEPAEKGKSDQEKPDESADTETGHDGHMRRFQHASLVLLVNKDGYVERAYNGGPPGPNEVIDDAQTVDEGW